MNHETTPPYLRDQFTTCDLFLPQKTADLTNFQKSGPNFKGFSTSKMVDFTIFFATFVKWDPLLMIFLNKMRPMPKDFYWKSNSFGRHIPVTFTCEYPPPQAYNILRWLWFCAGYFSQCTCTSACRILVLNQLRSQTCSKIRYSLW